MRNILLLIIAVLCFTACNDDKEENWVADKLVITLPAGENTVDAGDGNWAVNVGPHFQGTIKLNIETDKFWNISVDNITIDEEEWVATTVTEGNGSGAVDLTIAANTVPEYRKASITVTTGGEIPVSKKITVIQKNLGILDVSWTNNFLLTDNQMVFGPNSRNELVIGTFNAEGDEVTGQFAEDWGSITLVNGQIILKLEEFAGEEESQESTINLTNLNGGIARSISVKQYAKEIFSEKTNWTIIRNNENTVSQNGNEPEKLIDGKDDTYWERQWGDNGDGGPGGQNKAAFPYEFIIDLGEEAVLNTINILQRQNYHNACIKDIQLQFSNDNLDWTDGGKYIVATSKDECSEKKDAYSIPLTGTYQARYMKLTLLSNVSGGTNKEANLAELSIYLK